MEKATRLPGVKPVSPDDWELARAERHDSLTLEAQRRSPDLGFIRVQVELVRGADLVLVQEGYLQPEQVRRLKVPMLVDTGAYMLCINETVKAVLDLRRVDERPAELADGTTRILEVVGPIEVRFENRKTTMNALVLPGNAEMLLGAIPMEDLDVLIDPKRQLLIVNPLSPNVARTFVK